MATCAPDRRALGGRAKDVGNATPQRAVEQKLRLRIFFLQLSSLYVTVSRIITAPLKVEKVEIFGIVSTPLGGGGRGVEKGLKS